MLTGKIITGAGMIAAIAIVFYLTDMPGWAYAFPAALLLTEAAILARAHRIDAHR